MSNGSTLIAEGIDGNKTAVWRRSADRRFWLVYFHDTRFNKASYGCVTDDFGNLVPVTK